MLELPQLFRRLSFHFVVLDVLSIRFIDFKTSWLRLTGEVPTSRLDLLRATLRARLDLDCMIVLEQEEGVSKARTGLKAKKHHTILLQYCTFGNIEAIKSYRDRTGPDWGMALGRTNKFNYSCLKLKLANVSVCLAVLYRNKWSQMSHMCP